MTVFSMILVYSFEVDSSPLQSRDTWSVRRHVDGSRRCTVATRWMLSDIILLEQDLSRRCEERVSHVPALVEELVRCASDLGVTDHESVYLNPKARALTGFRQT